MSDRDAPAIAKLLCKLAGIVNLHVVRRFAESQMHVDIVFAGQREDAVDLSVIVGIVSGCGTKTARPPVEGLN